RSMPNSWLQPPLEQVSAFDQAAHLAIHYAPLQHPESAIGVDVAQPLFAHRFRDLLDARSHKFGSFNFVVFDVDHSNAEPDRRIQILERFQLVIAAASELQHQVIAFERIQKRNQIPPESAQHRLAAVISKADVDSALVQHAVEYVIDRFGSPRCILWRADD